MLKVAVFRNFALNKQQIPPNNSVPMIASFLPDKQNFPLQIHNTQTLSLKV